MNWDEYKGDISVLSEKEKTIIQKKALISLTKQSVRQLEEDALNVKTDAGRSLIYSEIDELKRILKEEESTSSI